MDVGYLGPENTYTHKAAQAIFPEAQFVPRQSIRSVVRAIDEGMLDYGVIPFENLYNGSVVSTLDSLQRSRRVKIVGEKSLQVLHCFGALPNHGEIKDIYSKDQALEQCWRYLDEHYADSLMHPMNSTAEAALYIHEKNLLHGAAIASREALIGNGLEVLAEDICPNNRTRFVTLGTRWNAATGDDKTILSLHPPYDKEGVLSGCLNILAALGINLEGINSRPDGDEGYHFYVELNGHICDAKVEHAVHTLQYTLDPENYFGDTIKILGSFANSHWKDKKKVIVR